MGTHADSDDIENDEDDDDLWQSSPIALTDAQAKIAAAALETMLVAEDSTSEDERERRRRDSRLARRERAKRFFSHHAPKNIRSRTRARDRQTNGHAR